MKRILWVGLLLLAGCSSVNFLSEEKVRVIASLNTCYELTLRHSDVINSIRKETGYDEVGISEEWKTVYANQRHLVHKSPFYCDLWLNNPDFIDEVTVLLK